MDALRAVAVAGVERSVLHAALAASLVKHEEDRPVFDAIFATCFPIPPPPGGGAGRRRRRSAALSAGVSEGSAGRAGTGAGRTGEARGSADADEEGAPQRAEGSQRARHGAREAAEANAPSDARAAAGERAAERQRHPRPESGLQEGGAEPGGPSPASAPPTAVRGAALLRRPLAALDPHEADAAHEVARELGRRLAARRSRRERRLRRGRIDVRRTIRASLAHGGVPIELERRGRRPGKPDLLVLCDVSGSVSRASELLLAILAGAESAFRRVQRFAFVDRPVEVAFAGRHLLPAEPLDLHARSDFGAVLRDLETRFATRIDPATVLLVLGDARNNRRPPRADLLKRLAARSRALVWAVPEPRQRWYTGDSALAAYQPACSFLVEATSLAGLLAAIRESLRR